MLKKNGGNWVSLVQTAHKLKDSPPFDVGNPFFVGLLRLQDPGQLALKARSCHPLVLGHCGLKIQRIISGVLHCKAHIAEFM